jgi:DNA replication protein DnaC
VGEADPPRFTVPDELEVSCSRCRDTFRYTPVRVGNLVVSRQTLCPACAEQVAGEDRQLERDDATRQLRAAREDRERRRLELLHSITGNAAACRHMTLDSFDASGSGPAPLDAAREFVREVLEAPDDYPAVRGIYFHGDTGPGKTHLAVGVIQALLADPRIRPEEIVFDRADELILRIQATYGTRESVFEAVLDRRFDAKLWVLDDLGTERPTDESARYLTLLLARRELRPTLITSNLHPTELAKRFAEFNRAESRFGPRYFRVLPVAGRDRRFDRPNIERIVA